MSDKTMGTGFHVDKFLDRNRWPAPTWFYGPVKVLDAEGNLVRIIPLEELYERDHTWDPSSAEFRAEHPKPKRSNKRKYAAQRVSRVLRDMRPHGPDGS